MLIDFTEKFHHGEAVEETKGNPIFQTLTNIEQMEQHSKPAIPPVVSKVNKRKSAAAKRCANAADLNSSDSISPQKGSKRKSPTVDLLQKIFPKIKATTLEQTLHKCQNDVLKTIEQLIKEAKECEQAANSSDSEMLKCPSAPAVQNEVAVNIPLQLPPLEPTAAADFSEIRKQFGFSKNKKPKNSFVRHKANYENALREQAAKVVVGAVEHQQQMQQQQQHRNSSCFDVANQIDFTFKQGNNHNQHFHSHHPSHLGVQSPCAAVPHQQLLSMFGNPASPPSVNPNGGTPLLHPSFSLATGTTTSSSPVSSSSSPNVFPPLPSAVQCPVSLAVSTPINSSPSMNSAQQRINFLNARNAALMHLNPAAAQFGGPLNNNNSSSNKVEPDTGKLSTGNNHNNNNSGGNTFLPNSVVPSLPHLSQNLFHSLMASTTGYRNIFPFFPGVVGAAAAAGAIPNPLASLGLLGAGLTGMAMQSSAGLNSNNSSADQQQQQQLLPSAGNTAAAASLPNFEQNFEDFNQKLLSQRNHQLQTALHNICGNATENGGNTWYAGDALMHSNSNGSSQSKSCDEKSDSL